MIHRSIRKSRRGPSVSVTGLTVPESRPTEKLPRKSEATLRLTPLLPYNDDTWHVRACKVEWIDTPEARQDQVLWFKFEQGIANHLAADDCDMFAIAMLAEAMQAKTALVIDGRVSPGLLFNLVEVQEIWKIWWPSLEKVKLQASGTLPAQPIRSGAVCAFSGGLDASFTLWRHLEGSKAAQTEEIKYAMLVQGFDIPLGSDECFAKMVAQCRAVLSGTKVKLVRVSSNFRELSRLDWDYTHGAALAALLSAFKGCAGVGVIASSHAYGGLRRNGASPITDHLFGSNLFRIVHDGASHTRTQKAAYTGHWPAVRDRLRVCWESRSSKNCGRCEKCIRTSLNFLASGHPIPATLPPTLDLRDVRKVTLYTQGRINMWRELLEESKARGIRAPWQKVVRFVIFKSLLRMALRRDRQKLKAV